jgi:hypothetical protein
MLAVMIASGGYPLGTPPKETKVSTSIGAEQDAGKTSCMVSGLAVAIHDPEPVQGQNGALAGKSSPARKSAVPL